MSLKDKVIFISGASRGVGKEIAIMAASQGAHVYITAKTTEPHPKLPGTIYTAAEEIKAAGAASVTPIVCDVRDIEALEAAVKQAGEAHGRIDVVVNNASALYLLPSESIAPSKIDLMNDIIVKASVFTSQFALPYLKNSDNAQILNIAPKLSLSPKWFGKHSVYTICKFSSSMLVTGLAHEFKEFGVRVNALWPATFLTTAAVEFVVGKEVLQATRDPKIMADAASEILNNKTTTGEFYLDHNVVKELGIDPDSYNANPAVEPQIDIYVEKEDLA